MRPVLAFVLIVGVAPYVWFLRLFQGAKLLLLVPRAALADSFALGWFTLPLRGGFTDEEFDAGARRTATGTVALPRPSDHLTVEDQGVRKIEYISIFCVKEVLTQGK
jgi:hypothetical protein